MTQKNPAFFTRDWFCWADALFAEFVMSLTLDDCPGETPHVPQFIEK